MGYAPMPPSGYAPKLYQSKQAQLKISPFHVVLTVKLQCVNSNINIDFFHGQKSTTMNKDTKLSIKKYTYMQLNNFYPEILNQVPKASISTKNLVAEFCRATQQ